MRKEKYKEFIFEVIIPALILALLIRTFVVQAFKIPSESMVPTLQIGDHLFVCKFSYGLKIPFIDKTILKWNSPKRGDVIVFRYPEDPKRDFIKRTIGLYGETFQVINKEIYINGTHLIEPYKIHNDFYPSATQFSPRDNWERSKIILPNRVFVMGDNRDSSLDSRFWGQLDINMIKGKALFIYWPPWRMGIIK
ncbi:signal peptidase I [Candidatus Desantisbacteria bacterium CG2_30_40_21]|uniref:Signal peptidase I n=4 Tax=unclassified Candidatus Desantisiibacteriota TaxID=3106372 RepID=A0A2M7NZW6_9BACT|nr:MAG: signal peptidase I [Candidatus Desantisbacteria bacterium CG2_30_40_21]PIP39852.1 MAG: signal peptidase I [Candidatus Desantisbacteria bacterium CG23_combo_of_CG06-09_8_20_14_all_40_23]PIY18920.1 MAG: signal peptidase I [Candidatus Desantisbacteria bacterium CG_4_10_14_3_um_filter_40_18]PJB28815.1 MAG: signal peptidase I [Candidatus Desantisbacteria bacterium CG_4_9_14_3_um_filter_40_11]